jgi:FkbM family methyltransferase
MLIPYETVLSILHKHSIHVRGILHIGAHECEELAAYVKHGQQKEDITWVEANPTLVEQMRAKGIPVYHAAISDKEEQLPFYITNNGQSSSLLPFGTHQASYPWCKVVDTIQVQTQTLASFLRSNEIPMQTRNVWNLDIQGAELSALQSAGDFLQYADAIYTEVNVQYVYKDCGLLQDLDVFLMKKGFIRVAISMTDQGWGDALYVRTAQ